MDHNRPTPMRLDRILAPRSIAVVGASPRPDSYGNRALANLVRAGFAGQLHGVHPTADQVHGVSCVPRLSDLPDPPDAVVIATPAGTVTDLVAEAGALGCGGAVVFASGFTGTGTGEALRRAATTHGIPVCGPNGNGVVALHHRAPMWGDLVDPGRPGPVGLISASGNLAFNALVRARGLRLHTVVSGGNQAVLDVADYLTGFAGLAGLRAVAIYLEAEGDLARLAAALSRCADRGIRVAVLNAGVSPAGAAAAATHTGSVAGDARVLRALVKEAGGAWAGTPHELLELAKTLAHGRRAGGSGLAVVSCSGGDGVLAADHACRLGVPLPTLRPSTIDAVAGHLPPDGSPDNPIDFTPTLFGRAGPTAAILAAAAADDQVGAVLATYDRPDRLPPDAVDGWDGALAGLLTGAAGSTVPVVIASTLPDLMPAATAESILDGGLVPVAGLAEAVACVAALLADPPDPDRLRAIVAAAGPPASPGPWLSETAAKRLLRNAGVPVPAGGTVTDVEAAVTLAAALGGPVAVKLNRADLRHKTDVGGVVLDVCGDSAVREAFAALRAVPGHQDSPVLVEAMAVAGVEVLLGVRRDGSLPVLVLALGGLWVEVLDDPVVIPLPVTPDIVRTRLTRLRGASVLTGGRGRPPVDLDRLADLATRVAALAVTEDLALVELNPVLVAPDSVTVVDAVVRRSQALHPPDQGAMMIGIARRRLDIDEGYR
jgi:acetate---CoA ligase (ADP-forming)